MRVLVYGVGVIGTLTVHELIAAGNDVAVVARGHRKEVLETRGLDIREKSGKKKWIDHPAVLSEYDGRRYDVTFSIMQNQQQEQMLDTLARVRTKYLVLVGNNMTSREMERILREKSTDGKVVLFAFQSSGGERHEEYTDIVTFGPVALMTIGHRKEDLTAEEKTFFRNLFKGSRMRFEFMDDMESWYRCHTAFVLPIAYISYLHHCNIRTCSRKDIDDYITAGSEAYDYLQSIGTKIRPKGDEKNLKGIRGGALFCAMWVVAKTKLGEECVTNHCRNAVTEMQFLDEKWEKLRRENPSFSTPVFDRLKKKMPSWEKLHEEYDRRFNGQTMNDSRLHRKWEE